MSKKRSLNDKPLWQHILIQMFLIFTLITVMFPIMWVVTISLDARNISRPMRIPFLDPEWWSSISLKPYINVLTSSKQAGNNVNFWTLFRNSVILAGGTSLLSISIGTSAAYSFSRFRFKGREAGLYGFIVLQMLPPTGTMAALYVLLNAVGLRTSHLGLIIAYSSGALPFAIWNMKGYMDTIPISLEEAAQIDGCTANQAFFRVMLPLATPALAITALFGFLNGWTEFALAWLLLENPKSFTLAMTLRALTAGDQAQRSVPWSEVMAFSVLLAIPVTVLFLFMQKYIVSGLTLGGVKG